MSSMVSGNPGSAGVASKAIISSANVSKKKSKRIITPNSKATMTSLDRRMTVDKDIVDELLLVCGVIGTTTNEGDELVPVTDCLNWLQDLQRALRRDEDLYRPISLLIGKWKVVEQKLLPLVMTCRYDTPMVLTIVKILVILTKPLSENTQRAGRMVIDTSSSKSNAAVVKQQIQLRENAIQQAELLMEYKRAVVASHSKNSSKNGLLSIFTSLLAEPLSKSGAARADADHLTIELVLHLLRNLLAAEPLLNTSSETSRQSNQLHQELITLFDKEMVLEIILVLGQEMELRENAQYNLLMMEFLHHLLKSHDPSVVANWNSNQGREVPKSSSLLAAKRKQELTQRRSFANTRHGHFGGTWVMQQRDGKRQYVGAAAKSANEASQRRTLAKRKNRKAEPFVGSSGQLVHSRRVPTEEGPVTRRANETLYKFCQRFLEDCYGPVIKSLKNEFRRDSVRLEEEDKVVFFRLVWFFNQWWRLSRSRKELGNLIFTMDLFTFNLVLNATDFFSQHKKYQKLAQTVALYSEMMNLLLDLQTSKDATENMMAMGLMDRLFYSSEPIDRLPKLLSGWLPGTFTREYLCDLVELCHVTFKLLDANEKRFGLTADQQNKKKQVQGREEKMKAAVAEFDVKVYFCRKIVSNHVVTMYIHLLNQYRMNATQINYHVLAMFLRLSRTEIATPEIHSADIPINPLGTRRVTLEPMLYNIQLILVLKHVLNDIAIRNDKDYEFLVTFAKNLLNNFWQAAQQNPMLYVECLFRHVTPHRFCESVTNMYVSEELQMLAERELLLEEQRRYESEYMEHDGSHDEENDDDEDELEFTGEALQASEVKKDSKKSSSKSDDDDTTDNESSMREHEEKEASFSKLNASAMSDEESSDLASRSKEIRVNDNESGEEKKAYPVETSNKRRPKGGEDSDQSEMDDLSNKRQRVMQKQTDNDSSDEDVDFGDNTAVAVATTKPKYFVDDDEDE